MQSFFVGKDVDKKNIKLGKQMFINCHTINTECVLTIVLIVSLVKNHTTTRECGLLNVTCIHLTPF